MMYILKKVSILLSLSVMILVFYAPMSASAEDGDFCRVDRSSAKSDSNFLGFPKWYKYIKEGRKVGDQCIPQLSGENSTVELSDIWLIALVVVEILMRLAGIVAFFMVLYGGLRLMTSQGSPEAVKSAKGTVLNAIIGMIIVVSSIVLIRFVSRFLQGS